jgi:hypothetical protein
MEVNIEEKGLVELYHSVEGLHEWLADIFRRGEEKKAGGSKKGCESAWISACSGFEGNSLLLAKEEGSMKRRIVVVTLLALATAVALLFSVPDEHSVAAQPPGFKRIKCQSIDEQRKTCPAQVGGDVRISRQISDTKCEQGVNWFWRRDGITVWGGCRADFEFRPGLSVPGGPGGEWTRLRCESRYGQRESCPANILGDVHLYDQLSERPCVQGRNWGWDRNEIWVDNGCRAEFEFRRSAGGGTGDWTRLRCESRNGRRESCAARIVGEVRLREQLGSRPCVQGRDWGWDRNEIWVDNGCRAEFEYRSPSGGGGSNEETITCESDNNGYRECRVNGRVRDARIADQLSTARCEMGRSWGITNNRRAVWVNRGCRARFSVRLRD